MNKLIFFLILIVNFHSQNSAQENIWELSGDMRFPVAGGAIFGYNDIIYIAGGYSEQLQMNVDWLQKYNSSQEVWKIVGNMHKPRYGLTGGLLQDTAYISGGVHDDSNENKIIEAWDYQTAILTHISDSADNFNRIFAAGIIVNNKYYIFGGNPHNSSDSTNLSYLVEYDIPTQSITYTTSAFFPAPDLPEQQMVAAIGNDIFIFGGVRIGISQKIYKFNTLYRTFEELSIQMSVPRAAGKAVYLEATGEIFIIGGYNETYSALNSIDVFSFDGVNYSIAAGPELNIARSNLMAINAENTLYVFGGYNENGEVISEIEKLITGTTALREDNPAPEKFELRQNYPNPFNPATKISFSLPEKTKALLSIINLNGEIITVLIDGELSAGFHEIIFDAASLPSGIYFYRLSTYKFSQTKKMLLLK